MPRKLKRNRRQKKLLKKPNSLGFLYRLIGAAEEDVIDFHARWRSQDVQSSIGDCFGCEHLNLRSRFGELILAPREIFVEKGCVDEPGREA